MFQNNTLFHPLVNTGQAGGYTLTIHNIWCLPCRKGAILDHPKHSMKNLPCWKLHGRWFSTKACAIIMEAFNFTERNKSTLFKDEYCSHQFWLTILFCTCGKQATQWTPTYKINPSDANFDLCVVSLYQSERASEKT